MMTPARFEEVLGELPDLRHRALAIVAALETAECVENPTDLIANLGEACEEARALLVEMIEASS